MTHTEKTLQVKVDKLELLLEKVAQERDYYYELWKKANAYIVNK